MSTSKWSVLLAILIVLLLPGLAVQAQPDSPAAPAGALIAEDATAQPVALDQGLPSLVLNVAGQLGGQAHSVAISPDGAVVYVGIGQTIVTVDASGTSQLTQLGVTGALGGNITDLALEDRTLYALVQGKGVIVIDVANAANPIQVAFYPLSLPRSLAVKNAFVYVAINDGLAILDASRPEMVYQAAHLVLPRYVYDVDVAGSYAYVAAEQGFYIVNVANPFHPILVSSLALRSTAVVARNGYAYLNVRNDAVSEMSLVTVEVRSPSAPVVTNRIDGVAGEDLCIADQGLFVPDGHGVLTFSITDPAQPVAAGAHYPAAQVWPRSCAAYSQTVLLAGDRGVVRIDASDLLAIRQVGGADTPGEASSVFLTPSHTYVADGSRGLRIMSLANPTAPQEVGFYDSPGIAHEVVVVGTRAYLADGYDHAGNQVSGLRILDVSNPTRPTEIGRYQTPKQALGLAVIGDIVYVASAEAGLRILDVANLSSPREIGYVNTHYAMGVALTMRGSDLYALVADVSGGVRIIDVSDPRQPLEISHLPETQPSGYWTAVAVRDTYAFVIGDLGYSSSVGLYVMDISDLAAPRFVGFAHTMAAAGIQIVGNRAYIGGGRNLVGSGYLTVFDVTDPLHPVDIGAYGTIGVVSVQQGLAYQASGGAGLRVVDVRALSTPVLNGSFVNGAAVDFAPMGDYGLLTGDSSLRVVDLADPARLRVVGSVTTTTPTNRIAVSGSYAYVTQQAILDPNLNRLAGGGLAIFDVSDPLTLTQTGFFATSNGYGLGPVAVSGRYVYAVDIFSINDTRPMDTLYIIDVANPAAPVQVGSYKAPGWIVDMAVQGQHMYLITVNDELLVLSLANPVQPVMVGFLGMTDYQDRAKSLAVAGNYAYVGFDARSSLWRHLLQVIDISDPTQPVVVSSQGDGGVIEALSIEEDRLYAAPIRVYDLSGDPALPREMASLPIPIYSLSVSVAAEGATIYLSNHSGGLVSIGTAPVTESLRFPLMLKSR
jgi:hypothetical protein